MLVDKVFVILKELVGEKNSRELIRGKPLSGNRAWIVLDKLLSKRRSSVLYEDEEINDNECYVIVVRVFGDYVYVLSKFNNRSRGYLLKITDELIDRVIEDFKKCSNR